MMGVMMSIEQTEPERTFHRELSNGFYPFFVSHAAQFCEDYRYLDFVSLDSSSGLIGCGRVPEARTDSE